VGFPFIESIFISFVQFQSLYHFQIHQLGAGLSVVRGEVVENADSVGIIFTRNEVNCYCYCCPSFRQFSNGVAVATANEEISTFQQWLHRVDTEEKSVSFFSAIAKFGRRPAFSTK
jgi:hypothetical protein